MWCWIRDTIDIGFDALASTTPRASSRLVNAVWKLTAGLFFGIPTAIGIFIALWWCLGAGLAVRLVRRVFGCERSKTNA